MSSVPKYHNSGQHANFGGCVQIKILVIKESLTWSEDYNRL